MRFFCCRFDECVEGGESILLDTYPVVEEMRKELPRLDRQLALVSAVRSSVAGRPEHAFSAGAARGTSTPPVAARETAAHELNAEAAAPDEASAMGHRSYYMVDTHLFARQHALAEFNPEAAFGKGGAWVRETIDR